VNDGAAVRVSLVAFGDGRRFDSMAIQPTESRPTWNLRRKATPLT
jgi:hypothetical protein